MRYLLITVALLFCIDTKGQTPLFISDPDTTISLNTTTHIVDKQGNVYLLAFANYFLQIDGALYDYSPPLHSYVYKVNPSDKFIRRNIDSLSQDLNLTKYPTSYYPVPLPFQFLNLKSDKDLLIVHGTYYGTDACPSLTNAASSLSSGDLSLNYKQGFEDTCWSINTPGYTILKDDSLILFYQPNYRVNPTYNVLNVEKRWGSHFQEGIKVEFDPNYIAWGKDIIQYESYAHQYLYFSFEKQLMLLDENFKTIDQINLYDPSKYGYCSINNMRVRPNFCMINYTCYNLSSKQGENYTSVINLSERSVRTVRSISYSDMVLANDHSIWAMYTQKGDTVTAPSKLVFLQMDQQLNTIRKWSYDKSLINGTKMSIYNDTEIIATGVYALSSNFLYPYENPDQLFVLRKNIQDIPVMANNSRCNIVSVSPNPTDGLIRINVDPTVFQGENTVLVSNTMGQLLWKSSFTNRLEVDLSNVARGLYFINITNNANKERCVYKLVEK